MSDATVAASGARVGGIAGQLRLATLDRVPAACRPRYDPASASVGIVHLGLGNFHRAHQAVYVDDALAAGERDWAICGINLRRREPVDRLQAQDGLYTLLLRGGDGDDARAGAGAAVTAARVIAALREAIAYPVDPQRAIARLADPAVRIVTLTITEKGYVDGEGSAIALLAEALARRQAAGIGPLTLLSCDNLSQNGNTLRRALRAEIERRGDARLLGDFDERVACPNTMVDRIVPATAPRALDEAAAATGLRDDWPVAAERFTHWVVEDRFVAGRPDWARDGVQFVRDVRPFEAMKLRLLNSAHSALACLGIPAGIATVDEAIAEPRLRAFVERLWREDLVPTLPAEVREASIGYRAALVARFANDALGHRLDQIAIDSSQKIGMRWLPPLRERLAAGQMPDALALSLAAWI
ncbi:MAG TPA: mannitol dehydrogenase family protein, partial [Burkholderiaceae bacterium]|nr:mannitol dehydrogenase family protein [Burkholderiaceae bacterium]